MPHALIAALLATFFAVAPALGQPSQGLAPRQDVVFEVVQTTTFGTSIFVVGDLPELGGNSTALAVKLSPAAYPTWRATVSLPAGRVVQYRYIARADGPGQHNTAPVWTSDISTLSVPDAPRPAGGKALWLTKNIDRPVLWWRPATPTSGGAFTPRPMSFFGPAVPGRPADTQWFTWGFHTSGEAFDFYFTAPDGSARDPAAGWHSTTLDGVFVQDSQLYSYVPAATVSAPRRDYNPAGVPTLFSPQLNQSRGYRVFLPRGYAEHPSRRYPVLYMHDGQNVFEQGPFGSWNAAPTLTSLQASGRMQEVIVVALDNVGGTRLADYAPPSDNNGRANLYAQYIVNTVKPVIDGAYRTLPDAPNTAAMGSSLGGVVSAYLGYDWGADFGRIGCMSTSWWYIPNYAASVRNGPGRPGLRIYMDCGDSGGGSNDGYWDSLDVRDAFIGTLPHRYALEGAFRFVIGFGHSHNEAAWSARLPGALAYLFPSQAEPNELLRTLFAPSWDVDGDGLMTIEDLYAQASSPRDLNFDGAADADDTALLERFLRRSETADMAQGQR